MIKVKPKNENKFEVMVKEDSQTNHLVTLSSEYYQKLTQGKISKEKLIEKSFEFLLEKEPKESILSSFDLTVIKNYFPKYEDEMRKEIT